MIYKFFEFNLATILGQNRERIPTTSTINQKSSNIFGSSNFDYQKL